MEEEIGYSKMKGAVDAFVEAKRNEYSYAYTTGYLQSVLMAVLAGASPTTKETVYRQFRDMVEKNG